MISAAITITRVIDDEEQEIDVYVSGMTEYVGSYNYLERGEQLADWWISEPKGIELDAKEQKWAEDALYEAM